MRDLTDREKKTLVYIYKAKTALLNPELSSAIGLIELGLIRKTRQIDDIIVVKITKNGVEFVENSLKTT